MISFVAHGIPATQGSARAFVRNGRAMVTHDSGKKLLSWRSVLASEAAKAMEGLEPFDAPIAVWVMFYLLRPKSASKRRTMPDRRPDLDKLARAVGDAIEGIVYTQDSRIVEWRLRKVYGSPARAEVVVRPAVDE